MQKNFAFFHQDIHELQMRKTIFEIFQFKHVHFAIFPSPVLLFQTISVNLGIDCTAAHTKTKIECITPPDFSGQEPSLGSVKKTKKHLGGFFPNKTRQ